MRQVFTSQRLETVEGVAHLLEQAGIAVHISNGRSYKGGMGGRFSFSEPLPANQQPALWIKHPEDQPRARQLLREAGLLDSTRPDQRATYVLRDEQDIERKPANWGWRIRIGLLVLIGIAAFITLNQARSGRQALPAASAAQPQAPATEPANEQEEVRVRITPSE